MKKLKKYLVLFVIMLFSALPIFTGCDFLFSSSTKLKTPNLNISETNRCLTWNEITSAQNYEIYVNDTLAKTIETENKNTIIYDFTSLLSDSGSYEFYIIATTDNIYKSNSEKSNVCTFNYKKKEIIKTPLIEDNPSEVNIEYRINNSKLNYIPDTSLGDVSYFVYAYSVSSGLKSYELTSFSTDLSKILTKNEIYAIRLGYISEKNKYITDDIKYYNPVDYPGYTDNIYLFDGQINDYYIDSIQELNNIIYYSFVYRIESFDIKISDQFKQFINNTYNGTSTSDSLDQAVDDAFDSFYETIAYISNNVNGNFACENGSPTEFNIKVSYGSVRECNTQISPNMLSSICNQARVTPYYESVDYTMLIDEYGENYDDFVSDKQFLSTVCTTSEQLYWAVENKITPVFKSGDTSSRAYLIYKKAKNVLLNIISSQMTDYEKALSIFDWISVNTNYDYTNYNKYNSDISQYPTRIPSFYLEGVFLTDYHASVCDGFAKSYSLLCNMLGIDCVRIVGDAQTSSGMGGHAWNKVLIDVNPNDDIPAQYYLVDITWTEVLTPSEHSYTEETLTHSYFGLSDDDVKDTHFVYEKRSAKFGRYSAPNNIHYYATTVFKYKGVPQDLVIQNSQELADMFDYLMLSGNDTIEVVIDYDYMLKEYEKVYGENSYMNSTKIDRTYYSGTNLVRTEYYHATDTYIIYEYTNRKLSDKNVYTYYKLKSNFQEQVMKSKKFKEQFIYIVDGQNQISYMGDNRTGILYVLTQNLMIDDITTNNEVEHLVNYLSQNKAYNSYYLYLNREILTTLTGDTYVERINNLFKDYLKDSNIDIKFSLIEDGLVIDSKTNEIATKYLMKVTVKN